MDIIIPRDEEERLRKKLEERTDTEAKRMRAYLAMPDLSRTPESPIYEIVERVKAVPRFKDFDIITIPEIVPARISFDLFDFAPDHPARSKSDTYYVDENNILRTHDTVFWYYYLNLPEVKEKIIRGESFGTLCYGKVYRKDEVDSRHMNVFHQIGGWYLTPDSEGISFDDLKNALSEVAKGVFGPETQIRFNEDDFPYTDPSLEVEINVKGTAAEGPARGEWLEILGGGMPKKSVLKKMNLEGYSGWAFGFGIERIAIASMALPDIRLLWSDDERVKKQLKLGHIYEEVSKFPPAPRDISFIVSKSFVPNDYFDLVRDIAGDLVEEISLIDEYENDEKFGGDKKSYTYRIIYRSIDRTLESNEVDALHKKLEQETREQFNAEIR
jgi:phenylalanyl-tRNA synthetase alpha chain